jgi:hypothetical protein
MSTISDGRPSGGRRAGVHDDPDAEQAGGGADEVSAVGR